MAFFTSAINILQTLVVAIGAGLAVWGVIPSNRIIKTLSYRLFRRMFISLLGK